MTSKLEKFADEVIDEQVDALDEQIQELERKLQVFIPVNEKLNRLRAARRALLGVGSRTTANAGNKVTQDEVAQAMNDSEDEGVSVSWIAEKIGTTEAVVRGHLNRNKERFLKNGNGLWSVNNPEEDE